MPTNKPIIIVDGNNRAHAAYHAYKRLTYKGKSVSLMYGLPSMIKGLMREYDPQDLFVVWDGKRSKHRYKLCPEYKGERNKARGLFDREDFEEQKATVMRMLKYLGIKQVLNPIAEADDVIASLVFKLRKADHDNIIIVSGDKDFHQLISRFVTVYSESRKKLIHHRNIKEEFGYYPPQTIDYLTLVGDDSDNIAGYPGIGEKRATDLLEKYGSLVNFIDSGDKHSIIDRKKLLELMKRNSVLMDLRLYHKMYKKETRVMYYKDISDPAIDRIRFLKVSAKYGMNKFMSSGFLDQFKILKAYAKKNSN